MQELTLVQNGFSYSDVEAMPTDDRLAMLTLLIKQKDEERKGGGDLTSLLTEGS